MNHKTDLGLAKAGQGSPSVLSAFRMILFFYFFSLSYSVSMEEYFSGSSSTTNVVLRKRFLIRASLHLSKG